MKVYRVKNKLLGSKVIHKELNAALDEIKMHLESEEDAIGNFITVGILEMSEEEFKALPEFMGY